MCHDRIISSPVGELTLRSDRTGTQLTGLWIAGQKHHGGEPPREGISLPWEVLPLFASVERWLDAYFWGERPSLCDVPIAPEGTAFQRSVWKILCEIPYGEVVTYGEIAKRLSLSGGMGARAVGSAVGRNPISIVIPCHRVVGAGGKLTGYAGGLAVKKQLLAGEGLILQGDHCRTTKKGVSHETL